MGIEKVRDKKRRKMTKLRRLREDLRHKRTEDGILKLTRSTGNRFRQPM